MAANSKDEAKAERKIERAEAKAKQRERARREAARVADEPSARKRPPTGALISIGLVVAVVLGFSIYLWTKNEQPGPALERWAEATRSGDCDASYGALSTAAKQAPLIGDQSNWCQIIGSPDFIGAVHADSVDIKGNLACVHASISTRNAPVEKRAFVMTKEGRSWKVDIGADPEAIGITGCTNATPTPAAAPSESGPPR